jgi:hypothetical protein
MNYTDLLKIPEQYDTIEKKLEWLEQESLREQKRDRMEQNYSFQLYKTKEYWKMKLKNCL